VWEGNEGGTVVGRCVRPCADSTLHTFGGNRPATAKVNAICWLRRVTVRQPGTAAPRTPNIAGLRVSDYTYIVILLLLCVVLSPRRTFVIIIITAVVIFFSVIIIIIASLAVTYIYIIITMRIIIIIIILPYTNNTVVMVCR